EQRTVDLWRLLRADSTGGARARRRAVATTAMATAVLGLLVAVGLVGIVLVVVASFASAVCFISATALLRRHRERLRISGKRLGERGLRVTQRVIGASVDRSMRAASRTVPVVRRAGVGGSASVRSAYRRGLAAGRSVV